MYLGVDVAYAGASAWALVDEDGQVLSAGIIVERDGPACFRKALAAVVAAKGRWAPRAKVHAAIEEPWSGINRRVGLELARRAGTWDAVLAALGATVERLAPNAWRSTLGLATRPRAKAKAEAQQHARLAMGWETDSADEADAACVADALRRRMQGAR